MGESDSEMVIGELKGSLNALVKAVDEQNSASRDSRLRVYNKLEETSASITRLEGHVGQLHARLAKIEPVAEDFSRWKERGVGVIMFIGVMSSVIGAGLAVLWKKIAIYLGIH